MCHLPQRQLAQGHQISPTKEIREGFLCTIDRVDVAALHARLQSFRREIGHHNLVRTFQDPVRNCFPHLNSGDALDGWIHALKMLDIHRGENVYSGVEQLEHVLVPFAVLASFHVRVGEFVHKYDLRLARQYGIHIHFLEESALVVELTARNNFQVLN